MISDLRFEVLPNPETNDHQTRVIVDGRDWLGTDFLGLDPPDLSAQLASGRARLVVGRCLCGVVGCCDLIVDVSQREDVVEWRGRDRGPVIFDSVSYRAVILGLAGDHSWEDLGRRVERRVGEVFAGAVIDGAATFDWASTRIKSGLVHLSFSGEEGQKLLEFSWDGASLESALAGARSLRRERCGEDFGTSGNRSA
jgi:hypothetical protein